MCYFLVAVSPRRGNLCHCAEFMECWNLSKNETIAKIFNFFVDGEIFACYISKTKNSSYGISVNILD